MGFARVLTTALSGIEAQPVDVEIHVGRGLPGFDIVGLPEGSVMEGRKRIRAAILSSGLEFPIQKITVNLAPADFKKGGARFDLPIAIGILAASGQLPTALLDKAYFVGELALDGSLRAARGEIATLLLAEKKEIKRLYTAKQGTVAQRPMHEALSGVRQHVSLGATVNDLIADQAYPTEQISTRSWLHEQLKRPCLAEPCHDGQLKIAEIQGQLLGKRAIAIAAAGFHSLFLFGPPGVGKSLLARAIVELLPPLTIEEGLDVLRVQSAQQSQVDLQLVRPFRNPHHSVSLAGMLGRNQGAVPGELALAHRGVLFLDEFAEFRRDVLEALRQPLESGCYKLSRAWGEVVYPSRFLLVAAMNPCPCGFHGDPQRQCRCSAGQIQRYQNRLSAPMLDRFDMSLGLQRQTFVDNHKRSTPAAEELSEQVQQAVARQAERYRDRSYQFNAQLPAIELTDFCPLSSADECFLKDAADKLQLSYRAYHRILRVARTIADLHAAGDIQRSHLLEALQYRQTMV